MFQLLLIINKFCYCQEQLNHHYIISGNWITTIICGKPTLKGWSERYRESLLHDVQRKRKSERMGRVPLVLTSSRLPDIHNIIRKNMPVLHRSEDMKKIFKEIPIIAYRRDRNLWDTLVHGKTNRVMRDLNVSVERCQKKCVVCEMLVRGLIIGKNAECLMFYMG